MTHPGESDITYSNELARAIHRMVKQEAKAVPDEISVGPVEGTRFVYREAGHPPLEVVVIQR